LELDHITEILDTKLKEPIWLKKSLNNIYWQTNS